MGKRKSSKIKPKTSKLPKLDKEFDCPFCSHSKAVKVELDRVRGIGALSCRICGAVYNRAITRLDEGIDVYGDWIDACVSANAEAAKEAQLKLERAPATPQGPSSRGPPAGAPEAASDGEARDLAKAKRERFALSGGRVGLKKLSRDAESEGEDSSSEEAEGASGGAPERGQGAHSRKRLKVDKDREETETAAAAESEGSDAETQKGGDRNAEVGGVLEQYRQEAEGEEEEADNALFHDDE